MRELRCNKCEEIVYVYEEPCEHIDPERYRCENCVQPVAQQELALDGHRVETRAYDPDQSEIGF